jgi:hypothetical protein
MKNILLALLFSPALALATQTTNLGLTVIPIGAYNWGTTNNANMAIVDSSVAVKSATQTFTGANTFISTSNVYYGSGAGLAGVATSAQLTSTAAALSAHVAAVGPAAHAGMIYSTAALQAQVTAIAVSTGVINAGHVAITGDVMSGPLAVSSLTVTGAMSAGSIVDAGTLSAAGIYNTGTSTATALYLTAGLNGIHWADGSISTTAPPGSASISGLTANTIPKATAANALGNSLLTDNATTLAYSGSAFSVGGSTLVVSGGAVNIQALTVNDPAKPITSSGHSLEVNTNLNKFPLFYRTQAAGANYILQGIGQAGTLEWALGSPGNSQNWEISKNQSGAALSVNYATQYVGIGTTAPAHKLDVAGSIGAMGYGIDISSVTINGGANTWYYCNGGVSVGNVCRGNGCSCVGGAWVAISLKTD